MNELNLKSNKPTKTLITYLPKHSIAHGWRKYVKTKFDFLRYQVNKQKLELEFYRSKEQQTDILAKS